MTIVITLETRPGGYEKHHQKAKIFREEVGCGNDYTTEEVKSAALYRLTQLMQKVISQWEVANQRCQACGQEKP